MVQASELNFQLYFMKELLLLRKEVLPDPIRKETLLKQKEIFVDVQICNAIIRVNRIFSSKNYLSNIFVTNFYFPKIILKTPLYNIS